MIYDKKDGFHKGPLRGLLRLKREIIPERGARAVAGRLERFGGGVARLPRRIFFNNHAKGNTAVKVKKPMILMAEEQGGLVIVTGNEYLKKRELTNPPKQAIL
jgi:hypothetical protein